MKSHIYAFRLREVGQLILGLAVPILVVAALARGAAAYGLLPAPWPAWDVERTILTHQARASRARTGADVLLLGDSSCVMGVSGRQLEALSGGSHRVINLGTFMYVGLEGYATLLARYADTNPGCLRRVVLLLHPEMLRGVSPARQYLALLSALDAGVETKETDSFHGQLCGLLGLDVVRDRLLSRLPQPLPKAYGVYYGFNLDLDRWMDQEHGSAVDPHQYVPAPGEGNAEYRLVPAVETGARALATAMPAGAQLLVGLAPVPESFAPKGYAAHWQSLLAAWGGLLKADVTLTNLPATLPDEWFASTLHLNRHGAREYTERLARSLQFTPNLGPERSTK